MSDLRDMFDAIHAAHERSRNPTQELKEMLERQSKMRDCRGTCDGSCKSCSFPKYPHP